MPLTRFRWTKAFYWRLLASYFVIPLIPPALLLLSMRGAFSDWLGIVYIYGIFGVAAMVALGTPLLLCYLRVGWTGFLPFLAGGGLCAGITAYTLLNTSRDLRLMGFFTFTGIIAGLLFRVILFGFHPQPRPAVNGDAQRTPASRP